MVQGVVEYTLAAIPAVVIQCVVWPITRPKSNRYKETLLLAC
jgi:hypothetical protein